MRVRYTALLASAALIATASSAVAQREVTVQAATIQSLDAKLQAFAQGLAPAERAAWNTVLRQAAGAPADNPANVPVRGIFYAGCGCTTGAPGAIIVQGGRTGIVVQGGRTTASPHIIVQGGTPPTRAAGPGGGPTRPGGDPAAVGPGGGCLAMTPRRPGDSTGGGNDPAAIGPKQEDPARGGTPPAARGTGDPLVSLDAKVHAFAATLSGGEQAAFDWLLQRAATQGQQPGPGGMPAGPAQSMETETRVRPGMPAGAPPLRRGGPGGLPEGHAPSLSQALGVSRADANVVLKF